MAPSEKSLEGYVVVAVDDRPAAVRLSERQLEPFQKDHPNVLAEGVVLRGPTAAPLLAPIPTTSGVITPALLVVGSHGRGKLTGLRMGARRVTP